MRSAATLSDDLEDYEQVLFELLPTATPIAMSPAAIVFHQARGATTDEVDSRRIRTQAADRDRGPRDGGKERKGGPKGQKRSNVGPGTGLIYVGVGRRGHIRPGDLVGYRQRPP